MKLDENDLVNLGAIVILILIVVVALINFWLKA